MFFIYIVIVYRKFIPKIPQKINVQDLPDNYIFFDEYHFCDFGRLKQICEAPYAYAPIRAMSHRFCKKLNKTIILSPQFALTCDITNNLCNGGCQKNVYNFIERNGASDISCHPIKSKAEKYSNDFCSKCENGQRLTLFKAKKSSTHRFKSPEEMRRAIFVHGPITTALIMPDSFKLKGRYVPYIGTESFEASEWIVELIGWVKEDDEMFWIGMDNKDYEKSNLLKIKMGENVGLVERFAYEALPDI